MPKRILASADGAAPALRELDANLPAARFVAAGRADRRSPPRPRFSAADEDAPPSRVRTLPELLAWRAALTPWRAAYLEHDPASGEWRQHSWRETADAVHRQLVRWLEQVGQRRHLADDLVTEPVIKST